MLYVDNDASPAPSATDVFPEYHPAQASEPCMKRIHVWSNPVHVYQVVTNVGQENEEIRSDIVRVAFNGYAEMDAHGTIETSDEVTAWTVAGEQLVWP